MKFLVLAAFLCTLVAATTAQSTTKSSAVTQMQNALGSMLSIMRDLSIENRELIDNAENQDTLSSTFVSLEELYNLFPVFRTSNRSALPLPSRTRLNNAFSTFQNAVAGWESALEERNPENLASTFQTIENAFLGLAGVVVSL